MEKNKSAKKIETEDKKAKVVRKLSGVVCSSKSEKTIIVEVNNTKIHPKYKKRYSVIKKYKVHDEKNQYKDGDKVDFAQCRPLSRDKKWRVLY